MPANDRGDKEQQTPAQEHRTGSRIVAGVDGSPSSMSALRWAIRQAALTGATVDAVMAWHYPVAAGGYGWAPTGLEGDFDFSENAEKVLADAISNAVDPRHDAGSGAVFLPGRLLFLVATFISWHRWLLLLRR